MGNRNQVAVCAIAAFGFPHRSLCIVLVVVTLGVTVVAVERPANGVNKHPVAVVVDAAALCYEEVVIIVAIAVEFVSAHVSRLLGWLRGQSRSQVNCVEACSVGDWPILEVGDGVCHPLPLVASPSLGLYDEPPRFAGFGGE